MLEETIPTLSDRFKFDLSGTLVDKLAVVNLRLRITPGPSSDALQSLDFRLDEINLMCKCVPGYKQW